jgi:histone-lysine N-methyltransferase SETMAR
MATYQRSHLDLSGGREKIPIEVDSGINLYDSGLLDFVYTRFSLCSCEDGLCTEQYEGCNCRECFSISSCHCISRFGVAYDRFRHLLDVNPELCTMRPVVECNQQCACDQSCFNRVVQHGLSVRLQIFDAGAKGNGVRTLQPIECNSFVCEYAGELLSPESARCRMKPTVIEHNYILAVHEFIGNTNKQLTTFVDPTYVGNVGRFINHSCDPNLYMVPVRVNNEIPKIALFALKNIEAGSELTYDYSGVLAHNVSVIDQASNFDGQRKMCVCGSSKCKSYLPSD